MRGDLLGEAERVIAEARAYLTVREYGHKYHVARSTVFEWIDEGLVDVFRVRRVLRVKDSPPKNPHESPPQSATR